MPEMIRWPGRIPAGVVSNEIVQHHDWLPTFLAAAGDPDDRRQAQGRPHDRRHDLQGPHRRLQPAALPDRRGGRAPAQGPRLLLRRRRRARRSGSTTGRSSSWSSARRARCRSGPSRSSPLRVPKLFNLRTDPFERADVTSNTYYDWLLDNAYLVLAATALMTRVPRRRSRSSRRARRPRASRSTRRSRSCEAVADVRGTDDGRPALLERHADAAGDHRLRRAGRRAGDVPVGGARRRLRQRRHAVVREADADRARLHPRAPRGDGRGGRALRERQPWKAAHEGDHAWLGGAITKHYQGDDGDVKLLHRRRHPGVRRLDRRGVRRGGGRVPRASAATRRSAARSASAATRRWSSCCATWRPTASRATSPPAATATSCARSRTTSTASRPSGSSAAPTGCASRRRATAARSSTSPSRTSSTTGRSSRSASGAASGAGRSSRSATPTATCRCLRFAGGRTAPALRLLVLHDDAEREFDYTAGRRAGPRARRTPAAGPSSASRTTGRRSSP